MPFSAVQPKQFNVPTQKIEYAYFERWEKCLCIVQNASFLLFLHFKSDIRKYFACYIILQLF